VLTAMRTSQGMTLIELMIGLVIVALLLGIGLPAFNAFIANTKLRSVAEGLQTGLSLARSEAMRRNSNVEFVLTNDVVDLGTFADAVPAANGIHWVVRLVDPATGVPALVEGKSGAEGTGRASGGSTVLTAASNPSIFFRGLGGTTLGATATFDVSNPQAGACHTVATPSPIRCLRVQVSVSGLIRMCDPATAAPDTRAC
jgi:type IV fimbrial biogenesis protein FimT